MCNDGYNRYLVPVPLQPGSLMSGHAGCEFAWNVNDHKAYRKEDNHHAQNKI
jgi:hypothetical protein